MVPREDGLVREIRRRELPDVRAAPVHPAQGMSIIWLKSQSYTEPSQATLSRSGT